MIATRPLNLFDLECIQVFQRQVMVATDLAFVVDHFIAMNDGMGAGAVLLPDDITRGEITGGTVDGLVLHHTPTA